VTACATTDDFVVIPLTETEPLPGGGEEAVYQRANGAITQLIPPAGFTPLDATAAQLSEYGFPAAPSSPNYTGWFDEMATWQAASSATPFLISSPEQAMTHDSDGTNWGGYIVEQPAGSIVSATAQWVDPSIGSSQCPSDQVAIWTGIDGAFGGTLAQDGTWYGHTGSWASGQAWWETVGTGSSGGSILMNLTVPSGNVAQANTSYVSSPSEYEFYVDNESTGKSASYTDSSGPFNFVGETYDAIAEDVNQSSEKSPPSSANPGLSNFGTLTFQDAWVGTTSGTETVDQFASASGWGSSSYGRDGLYITDEGGYNMTTNSPIGSEGSFTMSQNRCY
jgi:hypothetical protein